MQALSDDAVYPARMDQVCVVACQLTAMGSLMMSDNLFDV